MVVDFRTYVDCTTTVTTGCDQIIGNVIHDGGHVTGRITRVISPTTVIVTIASTTDPAAIPAGPVRLGHDLGHHAVALLPASTAGFRSVEPRLRPVIAGPELRRVDRPRRDDA